MPTDQLSSANKMQPQSTNQTMTANIQLYPASSNPMIQPQYSLWQYTADCALQYSRQVQGLCYVLYNRRLHKKLRMNRYVPDQIGTLSQVGTKKISKGGWTI